MNLDQYATMQGYQLANTLKGSALIDAAIDSESGLLQSELKTRRIQFDAAPLLTIELERICINFGCSKREFLEMAVSEAIARAETRFQEAFAEAAGHPIEDVFPG